MADVATIPSPGDIRAARSSRRQLYRKAALAYDHLRAIERLGEDAIRDLLADALIGPMERWRQFELALALAMAGAIAERIDTDLSLKNILPGTADAIIEVGPYAVRWQQAGPDFAPPTLTDWEQREFDILREYGISTGYDRPDVVVFDRRSNLVVAIGEAKYFEDDDWRDRVRGATAQVILYARAYEKRQSVEELIGRSLIAVWSVESESPKPLSMLSPTITTFEGICDGLRSWAARAIT
ncbi:MAG TPA: hypothetical protein VGF98_11000 [Candidatus Tumulicola sp.]